MDLTCSAKLVLKQTWEELKEAGTNLPGQSIVYIYIYTNDTNRAPKLCDMAPALFPENSSFTEPQLDKDLTCTCRSLP